MDYVGRVVAAGASTTGGGALLVGLWPTQPTAAAVVTVVLLVGSALVAMFVTVQKARTDRHVAIARADADADAKRSDVEAKLAVVHALTKRIEGGEDAVEMGKLLVELHRASGHDQT